MKKFLVVTTTAALALLPAATAAAAQDETITVEGLFFVDRNGDNVFNAGETVRANGPGVGVYTQGTNELVGNFATGPDGRYKAVLPKGPKYLVHNRELDYSYTVPGYAASESRTDADFPLRGIFLNGFTFVDANDDGVKQDDEKTHGGKVTVVGKMANGVDFNAETEAAPNGAYLLDLPLGEYTVIAPDLKKKQLALVKPKSDEDIDWLTGRQVVQRKTEDRNVRVDLRYFAPKADSALEGLTITPSKDTYTVGEQFDLKFKVVNKGDVPGKISVVLFQLAEGDVKLISRSENVTGRIESFESVGQILPGESITVEMRFEFLNTDLGEIYAFVRPGVGGFTDVDTTNQGQEGRKVIKVVEKGAETTTPTTTTTTPAPTSTTTTQAVAQAGNKSDLASTGASPLGFLALGALLLAAGTGAFFVARRRRS
ncbi:LPXTG cell wall anchor domain-containing protein [Lentzea flaviverrucosa]|uniref:LPXTG-motif cell wall anchor domain-containing protein n=1 Tax=Lentzea flaviverrucosa TaxID=200379 RepID=A0A1H9PX15_9PSEU|nr:LPXTG cell wall anchor domain-containing protein [Lentzea flaviverrucosa]RDI29698.1 LPXTG-motif cell wall-anchored protein [Lentzea flaviverrucosa]SER52816.1 LPXTG-motif cell wall anchor domain-containing protein [Lentzea flaviverrucosa]